MKKKKERYVLEELLSILELEKIEKNIFRGRSQDLGFGNIFGGQVLGQALSAASRTVDQERNVHSLHGYFLRPGDPRKPIIYKIDCVRDGKSFTTRRVVAVQNGKTIFFMSTSFQREEMGFEHQVCFPKVVGPETLRSELEMAREVKDRIPSFVRDKILCDKPIEFRPVSPIDPFSPKKKPPLRYVWFKTVSEMPDDMLVHRYMLAYASDFSLVATSLYPHGHTFWETNMQVASLDHAIWFHRDFRMDDWLLYVMQSPSANRGRGLIYGSIFTGEGTLIASVMQEALIRYYV